MLCSALLFSFSIPLLRKLVSEIVSSQEFFLFGLIYAPLTLTDSFMLADNFREVIMPDVWSIG